MYHTIHYVTMIDTFMSGWGPCEDKENMLIFICHNENEAQTVADNARARSDQKNVRISTSVPAFYSKKAHDYPDKYTDENGGYESQGYYCQIKDEFTCPRWYEPDAFAR